jgi:hypothetical protein
MPKHLNQAIDAKAVDLPSHEIADPWLSHSKELSGGGLCKLLDLDQLRQLNHEIGSDLEVLCLVFTESEITEYISG